MAEFIGVSESLEIFGISRFVSVPCVAIIVWVLVVKGTARVVERIFLVACVFYVAYLIAGFLAHPDWHEVAIGSLRPTLALNGPALTMVVTLVGTTIAPWMQFYLQSAIVEKGVQIEDYALSRLDVVVGCIVTDVVAFFIVLACGATIYKAGGHIESARDAAVALKPLAGEWASALFAFGLFNASPFAASILRWSTHSPDRCGSAVRKNRTPCADSAFKAPSRCSCAGFSTPSATPSIDRARARLTMVRTISACFPAPSSRATKLLSIFKVSKRKLCR